MFSSYVLSAHQVIPVGILGEDKGRSFPKTLVTQKSQEFMKIGYVVMESFYLYLKKFLLLCRYISAIS